ncbi:MAG: hypothetical protein K1W16_17520 [Lachnospiraceae bacterium]|jgi:hypothetical protein
MAVEKEDVLDEYKMQVKLHINEQLYNKGYISKELYDKAKKLIIKKH